MKMMEPITTAQIHLKKKRERRQPEGKQPKIKTRRRKMKMMIQITMVQIHLKKSLKIRRDKKIPKEKKMNRREKKRNGREKRKKDRGKKMSGIQNKKK